MPVFPLDASRICAVHLKDRLRNIETDRCDSLHDWLLRIVGALTAPTSLALMCQWRSRPQHQKRTLRSAPNLLRGKQHKQGDAADNGKYCTVEKHGRMANVVPK
jgi:hypothetical protein